MRILFVSNQLPYPPRNGVTIPTFNYISRLSLHHDVFLLHLSDNSEQLDYGQLSENKKYVNNIWIVKRTRKPRLIRIRDELTLRSPYSLAWDYNVEQLKSYFNKKSFDVVWVTPFILVDIIQVLWPILGRMPIYVAGINDSFSAMMRNALRYFMTYNGLALKNYTIFALRWLRSWPMAYMESRILLKYALILVQTDVEQKWLDKISNGALATRTLVLSNGVNESLLKVPIDSNSKDIVYFGGMGAEYGKVVSWLIKSVWPRIRLAHKKTRFFMIGKNASLDLRRHMAMDERIVYTEYLPDIRDVFWNKGVALAPVFKNYGLINKVIESMAAGVPVVGDYGSFNGIPGFENGRHGVIADDAVSMAASVDTLLNSPRERLNISYAARQLVETHFSWQDRIDRASVRLEFLLKKRCTTNT